MKKRSVIVILILIVALAAGGFLGVKYYNDTYITIDGQRYLREIRSIKLEHFSVDSMQQLEQLPNLQKLDLRDLQLTTDTYEAFRAILPDCDIDWCVPFQGGRISCSTEKLNITSLAPEDISTLKYFPNLTKVNARGCTDYGQLLALTNAYPDLDVYYSIELEGQFWPNSTTDIEFTSVSQYDLKTILKHFPQLQSVKIIEMPENPEDVQILQELYPNVSFFWQLEVCGVVVDNTATEIDLSGIPMENTEELERCLKYLPNLAKVDMCNCGISNEEMEALNNRHENTLFVWIVNIGPYPVRTDITYYIPVKYQQRVGQDDCKNLRYCTELVALDLGHMPIETCEFVSYMPHLKYLILADTSLKNIEPLADLKELVFLEIFLSYVTDYSPLLSVTSLEDLNICHTHGDMEPLTKMTWLKRLWWGANPGDQLSDEEHAYLQSCLPDTVVVSDLVYSTGRGWRQGGHYYDMRDYFGMWYMDQD